MAMNKVAMNDDDLNAVSGGTILRYQVQPGDTLDFICDFYSYDGTYQDSYLLGEQQTVTDNMVISDTLLDKGKSRVTYKSTDIYGQNYWS